MATTKTKTATKTVTKAAPALSFYSDVLKAWPKAAGAKPTAAQFDAAHKAGGKPGTKTAVALAMYMRPQGATSNEVTLVNTGPYLNKMRHLITMKAVSAVATPNRGGHKVYKLEVAGADKPAAKASKPRKAKAKAATKPRKAKAKATATPEASATA